MARSGQSLARLLWKHKDEGSLAELSQSSVSQAVPQRKCHPFLYFPSELPSRCQSRKDEQRVGIVLCPSPPSGAACPCQDVSLHIVMKGVIKVTAGWNGAYSVSLPLHPSPSSLVAHIVCLCDDSVTDDQHTCTFNGLGLVISISLFFLLATDL